MNNRSELSRAALDKASLRRWALDRRAQLSPDDLASAARQIVDAILAAPEVAVARCIAAYASFGREPATRHLLDVLVERDVLVLLPVVLADRDLDWVAYTGAGDLEPAGRGLVEPVGARLGTQAIARADVVLAPALAVDRHGARLGRGGGSYDRALARAARTTFRCALVYDGELLPPGVSVPTDAHDQVVGAAATPSGVHRFG